jgi:hypothetical protein
MRIIKNTLLAFAFCLISAPSFGQSDKSCSFIKIGTTKYVLNEDFSSEGFDKVLLYIAVITPEYGEMGAFYFADEADVFDVEGVHRFDFLNTDDILSNAPSISVYLHKMNEEKTRIIRKQVVCESRGKDVLLILNKMM